MSELPDPTDKLLIEGLAAQLYVKSCHGGPYAWWHVLREDIKRAFRKAASAKIAEFDERNAMSWEHTP